MADVKFGLGQISKPTPVWAKNIFRAVLYTSAITAIVLGTITEIPDHTKVVILKYSVEAAGLVHALTKLFGIDIGEDPSADK